MGFVNDIREENAEKQKLKDQIREIEERIRINESAIKAGQEILDDPELMEIGAIKLAIERKEQRIREIEAERAELVNQIKLMMESDEYRALVTA